MDFKNRPFTTGLSVQVSVHVVKLVGEAANVRIKQIGCKQISALDRFQLIWTQLRNIRVLVLRLMWRMMLHR